MPNSERLFYALNKEGVLVSHTPYTTEGRRMAVMWQDFGEVPEGCLVNVFSLVVS